METTNIVLCGLGGQGILFMTKVLSESALYKGQNVLGAETHGMAQRGGSVVSHLRIGEVSSSLVKAGGADLVLALDESEGYRNLGYLKEGSGFYVNARPGRFPDERVTGYLEKLGVEARGFDAGALALELGAPMSTNLALLGYFASFGRGPVSHEEMRETIERITPERFLKMNMEVFDKGFSRGDPS
jgi:indolepyruvate ferredoxin oxidoreductase beta subunit